MSKAFCYLGLSFIVVLAGVGMLVQGCGVGGAYE
jgi:hypothetical protein